MAVDRVLSSRWDYDGLEEEMRRGSPELRLLSN